MFSPLTLHFKWDGPLINLFIFIHVYIKYAIISEKNNTVILFYLKVMLLLI